MNVDYIVRKDVLVIFLSGELDEYNSAEVRRKIDWLFDKQHFRCAVFDLSKLSFMDSTGVGMFIGRYKKMQRQNKKIYLQNPCLHVEKILRMSGIYNIMPRISKNEVI